MGTQLVLTTTAKMSKALKLVKESDLKKALANFHSVNEDCIQILQWSESSGSAADDGFTTELVAVKGKSKIFEKFQDFSFMVKMTPEIGHRVKMVKEMRLFLKEYLFYGVILPKLSIERSEKGLEKLAIPKCFYAHP